MERQYFKEDFCQTLANKLEKLFGSTRRNVIEHVNKVSTSPDLFLRFLSDAFKFQFWNEQLFIWNVTICCLLNEIYAVHAKLARKTMLGFAYRWAMLEYWAKLLGPVLTWEVVSLITFGYFNYRNVPVLEGAHNEPTTAALQSFQPYDCKISSTVTSLSHSIKKSCSESTKRKTSKSNVMKINGFAKNWISPATSWVVWRTLSGSIAQTNWKINFA